MRWKHWSQRTRAIGVVIVLAVLLSWIGRSVPALFAREEIDVEGGEKLVVANQEIFKLETAQFSGVGYCRQCHDEPRGRKVDFVQLTEYTTWKTKDKHALAYTMLEGTRAKQIGALLSIQVTTDRQCLSCHAMNIPEERQRNGFGIEDGVSCDVCHGPAEKWEGPHANDKKWRQKSPEAKESLGMFDVRNPVKRARLCMSCHVGNAAEGKVLTHAMFAAGHPPLGNFEVATFSKNLPQHWIDSKDAAFQQTKLVMASSVEALRSMMDLIGNRASHAVAKQNAWDQGNFWPPPWLRPLAKNEPQERWPELAPNVKKIDADELRILWPEIAMAQSDCLACHHELKSNESWRQIRGYHGRKPGRPQVQSWPLVLASIALSGAAEEKELADKLERLSQALDGQPFGAPNKVAAAALDLKLFSETLLDRTASVNREKAGKILKALLSKETSGYLDHDSARQIASATKVVYSEWKQNHPREKEIEGVFVKLDNELDLSLASVLRKKFFEERHALTKDPTTKLDKAAFAAKLYEISERELSESLEKVGNYDPILFKKRMEELSRLISGK